MSERWWETLIFVTIAASVAAMLICVFTGCASKPDYPKLSGTPAGDWVQNAKR